MGPALVAFKKRPRCVWVGGVLGERKRESLRQRMSMVVGEEQADSAKLTAGI